MIVLRKIAVALQEAAEGIERLPADTTMNQTSTNTPTLDLTGQEWLRPDEARRILKLSRGTSTK
jgi:hypothetical protein